jgi:WD40 repeat protein
VPTQTVLHEEPISDLNVKAMAISANGRYLSLPSTKNKETQIWQKTPWQHHLTLPETHSVTFHPDEQSVVGTQDGEIVLLSLNDGSLLRSFEEPESFNILTLQFTADGQTLVGLLIGGRVLQWDVATGALKSLTYPPSAGYGSRFEKLLAVSADGRLAGVAQRHSETDANVVNLIDLQTGLAIKSFDLGSSYDLEPDSLSFSPDGQNLAIGSREAVMIYTVDN